jgi:hypothetical protein
MTAIVIDFAAFRVAQDAARMARKAEQRQARLDHAATLIVAAAAIAGRDTRALTNAVLRRLDQPTAALLG